MLGRAVLRRCPWCGDRRAYFTGWFSRQDTCRRCGTPWRRDDVGFALGAATMNVVLTCGLIVIGATIGMILTAPDFAVAQIIVGLVVGALVVPVVLYPVTYTLWQAVDLAMRQPDAEELAGWSVRALLGEVDPSELDVADVEMPDQRSGSGASDGEPAPGDVDPDRWSGGGGGAAGGEHRGDPGDAGTG